MFIPGVLVLEIFVLRIFILEIIVLKIFESKILESKILVLKILILEVLVSIALILFSVERYTCNYFDISEVRQYGIRLEIQVGTNLIKSAYIKGICVYRISISSTCINSAVKNSEIYL